MELKTTHGFFCNSEFHAFAIFRQTLLNENYTVPLYTYALIYIYRAHVKTDTDSTGKSYIGLTEGPFKQRYNNHTLSFRDRKRENSTELSKYVWKLKDEHTSYKIHWTILAKAAAYNNKTKRCNLCLTEKLHIIRADTSTLLNKRSELISKCRHENKFLLKNLS